MGYLPRHSGPKPEEILRIPLSTSRRLCSLEARQVRILGSGSIKVVDLLTMSDVSLCLAQRSLALSSFSWSFTEVSEAHRKSEKRTATHSSTASPQMRGSGVGCKHSRSQKGALCQRRGVGTGGPSVPHRAGWETAEIGGRVAAGVMSTARSCRASEEPVLSTSLLLLTENFLVTSHTPTKAIACEFF